MKNLNQILNECGSDKGSLHGDRHRYSAVYSALFDYFKFADIKLLEVGVWEGSSLLAWSDYFPNAQIFGAEIAPAYNEETFAAHPRIRIYEGDATDPNLIDETGFHIVIDDADHAASTQIKLLETLWYKVVPGGFYIIEDLFVGDLPWGVVGSSPVSTEERGYSGHASGGESSYFPKNPQDLQFVNRLGLPRKIQHILNFNQHFFTISSVGKKGGLHMMLVIRRS